VAHGIARRRADQLVTAFVAQGVLSEDDREPSLTGRVAVVGAGAVPAHLAEVLRESGVSEVQRHVDGVGDTDDARADHIDLAIITSAVPVPAGAGEVWRRAGIAHLPVWCGRDHASVGPLVVPGSGPCLQCLELTRLSLDPAWSWIRAQISGPRVGALVPVESQATTRSLLVGIAASLAISALTDGPAATGWSFDAASPGPTFERRRWPRHPTCPRCGEVEQEHGPAALSGDGQVDTQQWAG
jgi:bacteriocin biosynthesis cyclodehydratase domain-containing protein